MFPGGDDEHVTHSIVAELWWNERTWDNSDDSDVHVEHYLLPVKVSGERWMI